MWDRIHRALSRTTSTGEYWAEIDGLRFVAITSVVFFHCAGMIDGEHPLKTLLRSGSIGVQLFFAISGFILARPFLLHRVRGRQPVGTRRYFARRLTRLEPPYLINLLLLLLIGGWAAHRQGDALEHLLASATYTHYFVYGRWSTINFVAWSLEIEAQFYLLMPLVAWLCFRIRSATWRRVAILAPCVPAIAWQAATHGDHFPHGLTLLDQIQFFAVGIVLSDVFLDWRPDRAPRGARWDLLATLGFGGIAGATLLAPGWGRVLVPLSIAAAFAGTLNGRFWRAGLRNRWVSAVGGMCYTIYLYHYFVLAAAMRPDAGAGFVENLLLAGLPAVLAVLVVSVCLFVAVEKPFMQLGVRDSGGRRDA